MDDPRSFAEPVDLVISGAAAGPQDAGELALLEELLAALPQPPALLFGKPACGETFAVSGLLSVAMACRWLNGEPAPPPFPVHPALSKLTRTDLQQKHGRVLVMAADRRGSWQAGVVELG